VAIAKNGNLVALRESHDASYTHAENLAVYIKESLDADGIKPSELDAVCVSKGPGSYTGLRIGVSSAKGMCYGLGIPMLSVGPLESMTHWAKAEFENELTDVSFFCPMIDARRMEVYTQMFDASLTEIEPISALIIDENSFGSELEKGRVAFFGDGAAKCKQVINHPNAVFLDDFNPSARGMIALAEVKFAEKQFEDVAYFEPHYLKDFVAGKPKKMF